MKQSQIAIIIGSVIVVMGGYILIKTSNGNQPQQTPEGTTSKTTLAPVAPAPNETNAQEQKDSQEGETNGAQNGPADTKNVETEQDSENPEPTPSQNSQETNTSEARVLQRQGTDTSSSMVTYTSKSYSPAVIHIKKGETVIFKNEGEAQMWTASAIHPTHTVYPESDIKKCGARNDAPTIFDMCQGYKKGQQWSFAFNEVGTWKYHNHLHPADTGTIVVE